jgi:hypothetical protein
MADAKTIELADGIVALLNAAAPSMEFQFQASRAVAVSTLLELQELKDLRVSVFTGSVKRVRGTRKHFDKTYKPVIAIQRKFDGGSPEQNLVLDARLELLEEQIVAALENVPIAGLAMMQCDEEQDKENFSAEAAFAVNVFASSITLTYQDGQ